MNENTELPGKRNQYISPEVTTWEKDNKIEKSPTPRRIENSLDIFDTPPNVKKDEKIPDNAIQIILPPRKNQEDSSSEISEEPVVYIERNKQQRFKPGFRHAFHPRGHAGGHSGFRGLIEKANPPEIPPNDHTAHNFLHWRTWWKNLIPRGCGEKSNYRRYIVKRTPIKTIDGEQIRTCPKLMRRHSLYPNDNISYNGSYDQKINSPKTYLYDEKKSYINLLPDKYLKTNKTNLSPSESIISITPQENRHHRHLESLSTCGDDDIVFEKIFYYCYRTKQKLSGLCIGLSEGLAMGAYGGIKYGGGGGWIIGGCAQIVGFFLYPCFVCPIGGIIGVMTDRRFVTEMFKDYRYAAISGCFPPIHGMLA